MAEGDRVKRPLPSARRGVITSATRWPGWARIAEDAHRRFQRGSSFRQVGRWLAAITRGRG